MSLRVMMAVLLAGCATPSERRAETIAAGERMLKSIGDNDRNAPDLHFQLGLMECEEAKSLAKSSPATAHELWSKAWDHLDRASREAGFEHRDEALFWRAEALFQLHRWAEAVDAWKNVPRQVEESSRLHAQLRLAQGLRLTHQCEAAVSTLEGAVHEALVEERCRCLSKLDQPCPGKGAP